MYAVPRPNFPSRCSTCSRGSFAAKASASCPVPSGEASSTTRISRRESWASTCGTRWGMFPASLYVGITTSPLSGMPCASRHDGCEYGDEEHGEGTDGDRLAQLVQLRVERELHALGAGRQRQGDQRVIAPEHRCGLTVDAGLPVGVPVLR